MNWDEEWEWMARRVIHNAGCYPIEEWLGIAYLCFAEQMDGYDPTKCENPLTYFAYRLRERIQNERRYNSSIIHIPVKKRGTVKAPSFACIDEPVSGDGALLADILADPNAKVGEIAPISVAEILDMVDPDDRMLFVRHHLEGVSMEQMASESGVTRQAIHAKMNRIRTELQKKLKKSGRLD